jgi:hypothetical protein
MTTRKREVPFKPSVSGRPHHSVIEKHPRRGEIEADIGRGVSERVIARKYDISRDVVHRWSKTKIPPQLRAKRYVGLLNATSDLETLRIEESDGLLKNLAMQRARLLRSQDLAIELEDLKSISFLSGQIHKNLELVGRYLGDLPSTQYKPTSAFWSSRSTSNYGAHCCRLFCLFPRPSRPWCLRCISSKAQRRKSRSRMAMIRFQR